MKKGLIVLMLLLTLGMGVQTVAQKHRHTPRATELVDTTKQHDALEVYSDTTMNSISYGSPTNGFHMEWDDDEDFGNVISRVFGNGTDGSQVMTWMVIAIVSIVVVALLLPLLIIFLIFYLVNRNRKQRMKLAQMAMEKGQPIPDELLEKPNEEISDEYQQGLRQCFVGLGLAIFLGIVAHEIGFGIGALVFFIGLGKIIAAKTANK